LNGTNIAEWSLVPSLISPDELATRQAISGLHLDMNSRDERAKTRLITASELADHYRQRKLKPILFGKPFNESPLQRLDKQMNLAALGRISARQHQRWRRYTLVAVTAAYEVELRQDQKYYEPPYSCRVDRWQFTLAEFAASLMVGEVRASDSAKADPIENLLEFCSILLDNGNRRSP
jgi:hypothetical protein